LTSQDTSPDLLPETAQRRDSTSDSPDNRKTVTFEDNRLLATLFGEFDQNLAMIEHRLGVVATARGNQVLLTGPEEACDVAARALENLYARIADGETLAAGDIDGAMRLARADSQAAPENKRKRTKGPARIETRRRSIMARSPAQESYINLMRACDLVFATGPAGTGKTYLAVAHAAALLEQGKIDRIILSRPAVEAGEQLGFLPGDLRDKVDPYMRPLYDALYDVMSYERVERELQLGVIEIAPLAFMRGRTLSNAAIILDESQNCTPVQMKMFLTRLGEKSRMIVTGDPSQTDLPRGQKSGLADAVSLTRNMADVGQVAFSDEDVVRHELVTRIVMAYREKEGQDKQQRGTNMRHDNAGNEDQNAPPNAESGDGIPDAT